MNDNDQQQKFEEHYRLLFDLISRAKFADMCCDDPRDRMWHAADNTWWKRQGNKWFTADPPPQKEPCQK